jgi:PKD domain/Bacterial Ig domain
LDRWKGTEVIILAVLASIVYFAYAFNSATAQQAIEDSATPVRVGDAAVASSLVINNAFIDPEHHCEGCSRMVYTPGSQGEAGLAYKDNNLDLGNSQRIVFFAKGPPNKQVAFVAAGNDSMLTKSNDTDLFPKINFTVVTDNVTLKNDWQRFEIGLNGTALSDATYPFGIQFSADSTQKQVFYIKGVTLDNKPAQNPIPTAVDFLNSTSVNSTDLLTATELLTANIDSNGTNYEAAPATIEFKANSTGGLAPYSFNWNFGDGSNGTGVGEKVSHTFDKPGNYTITLAAKDSSTPSQNAYATKLVTISSFDNKTGSEPLTANSTVVNNTIANTANNTIANTANNTIANTANNTIANTANNTIANTANNTIANVVNPLETVKNTTASAAIEVADLKANNYRDVPQPVKEANSTTLAADRNEVKEVNSTVSATKSAKVFGDAKGEQVPSHSEKIERLTTGSVKNLTGSANIVNHSPVAKDQSLIIHANKPISIVLKGTDPDNDRVTFKLISDPLRGVLAGFNKDTGTVIYIPNSISPGSDIFTFKVIDIHNRESKVGSVSFTIPSDAGQSVNSAPGSNEDAVVGDRGPSHGQSVNSAPIADNQRIKIDKAKNAHITLLSKDADSDKLIYSVVHDPSHGKITAFEPSTGKLIYSPDGNFAGQDIFTYKATDEKGQSSNVAKVEIKVIGGAKRPVIATNPSSTEKAVADKSNSRSPLPVKNNNPYVNAGPDLALYGGTNNIILRGTANDPDGDPLTYSWKQTGGPVVNLDNANSPESTFNAPVEVGNKVLGFALSVTDGRGGEDTDDVKVIIIDKSTLHNRLYADRSSLSNQTLGLN